MIDLNTLALSQPVIEFTKLIEVEMDGFATEGMRAKIVSVRHASFAEIMQVTVSYVGFEEYNKPFEDHTYYDTNGKPTLTAREANLYGDEEEFFIDENSTWTDYFSIVNTASNNLLNEYSASGSKLTYIAWLEQNLVEARKG